jgi:hypothetical protein
MYVIKKSSAGTCCNILNIQGASASWATAGFHAMPTREEALLSTCPIDTRRGKVPDPRGLHVPFSPCKAIANPTGKSSNTSENNVCCASHITPKQNVWCASNIGRKHTSPPTAGPKRTMQPSVVRAVHTWFITQPIKKQP